MNHAFNGVILESGQVLYVEPAPTGKANKYRMEDVWKVPEEYGRAFNHNRTFLYATDFTMYAFFSGDEELQKYSDIFNKRMTEWDQPWI